MKLFTLQIFTQKLEILMEKNSNTNEPKTFSSNQSSFSYFEAETTRDAKSEFVLIKS